MEKIFVQGVGSIFIGSFASKSTTTFGKKQGNLEHKADPTLKMQLSRVEEKNGESRERVIKEGEFRAEGWR